MWVGIYYVILRVSDNDKADYGVGRFCPQSSDMRYFFRLQGSPPCVGASFV